MLDGLMREVRATKQFSAIPDAKSTIAPILMRAAWTWPGISPTPIYSFLTASLT